MSSKRRAGDVCTLDGVGLSPGTVSVMGTRSTTPASPIEEER